MQYFGVDSSVQDVHTADMGLHAKIMVIMGTTMCTNMAQTSARMAFCTRFTGNMRRKKNRKQSLVEPDAGKYDT